MPLGTIQVPFPDTTMPGTPGHFQESGGRIINSYIEPLGQAAPSTVIYRRAPGLRNFGTTVRTGFRGGIQVLATLYTAWNNRLVTFAEPGGAATDVGAFPGTLKGFFARNNRSSTPGPPAWITATAYSAGNMVSNGGSQYLCTVNHTSGATFATDLAAGKWVLQGIGPDIVFVDPDGNMIGINGTAINTTLTRPSDMAAPNSVCAMDGFFVYTISDGKVWASDSNSNFIPALSFGTAENKPDGLVRGVPWAGQLFLFGPSTTEVWANAGTTPFPFARSVVIPRGIAGPYCVSGFEDNFSRALVWVADDNTVVRLNGYLPEKISPPDLDGLIEREPAVSGLKPSLEMSCFISRGHAFILLSAPTWSWVFDLNTNKWAERKSYLQARSRITGSVFAFNKWLCGDLLSNNVQEITNQAATEVGLPFRWQLDSGAVENFPVGARVGRFDCEFVTGVGMGTGSHAQIIRDIHGGAAFSTPTGTANRVSLTVDNANLVTDGDAVVVSGVSGMAGVNGTWAADVVDFGHTVTGAVANTAGRIRLTLDNTGIMHTGGTCRVTNVKGTIEANATWTYTVVDGTQIDLDGSVFLHAYIPPGPTDPPGFLLDQTHIDLQGSTFPVGSTYTGGGTLTDLASVEPIETDPVVEISWSDDGGQNYSAPIIRKLGKQAQTRQLVSLIACTGRSSWNARRWRLQISDPVYVGFMAAYQARSPKVSDIG